MSGITELAELYSAIEESSRQSGVSFSREKVWPVLTAYQDAFADTVIAFRVETSTRHARDFDYRFMVSKDVDPYARAVSDGLTAPAEYPVGALLSDIADRFPIEKYALDFGVVGGFKKIYIFFPADEGQELSKLAALPSMPSSLREHLDVFTRRGLDARTSMVAIDYLHRTVNVYFSRFPAECLEPDSVRSLVRELGLPEPSEGLLEFARGAFAVYVTLSWDSPEVGRICFPVTTSDPLALPVRVEAEIEQFVKTVQHDTDDGRFVCAATLTGDEEYYKLQSYYQSRRKILDVLLPSASAAAEA